MPKPPRPPGKPGISSSSSSVTLVGADLALDQSNRVIEQTFELNQNIPISGIQLIMAKSHVTVYFGTQVAAVLTSGSISINVNETINVSAGAVDANGNYIDGRVIAVTGNSNSAVVQIVGTSGTSASFNITIKGLAAGSSVITVACDGVTGTINVGVTVVTTPDTPYFADRFTGGVRHSANGYGWEPADPLNTFISNVNPYPGDTHSIHMKFGFSGAAEQRGFFGSLLTEFYIGWYHYIPNGLENTGSIDYFHRNGPSSDNNKWFRVWDNYAGGSSCSYSWQRLKGGGSTRPDDAINGSVASHLDMNNEAMIWGSRPGEAGNRSAINCGSRIGEINTSTYNFNDTLANTLYPSSKPANSSTGGTIAGGWHTLADHGTWKKFVGHYKLETVEGANDGAVEWWKEDVLKWGHTKLNFRDYERLIYGLKYFYLLGAANSGWNGVTVQQIARVRIGPTYASADPANLTGYVGG